MINGRPLPLGYAVVILDTLAKEKYGTVELEMTMDDDRSTLVGSGQHGVLGVVAEV